MAEKAPSPENQAAVEALKPVAERLVGRAVGRITHMGLSPDDFLYVVVADNPEVRDLVLQSFPDMVLESGQGAVVFVQDRDEAIERLGEVFLQNFGPKVALERRPNTLMVLVFADLQPALLFVRYASKTPPVPSN